MTGRQRILGLDIATTTGWGVVDVTADSSISYVASGVFTVKARGKNPIEDRLLYLSNYLQHIITRFQPTCCVIEEMHVRFASAAMSLGKQHGAAILTIARNGLTVTMYQPKELRLILGNGAAKKPGTAVIVQEALGVTIKQPRDKFDETDALAVCLAAARSGPV